MRLLTDGEVCVGSVDGTAVALRLSPSVSNNLLIFVAGSRSRFRCCKIARGKSCSQR